MNRGVWLSVLVLSCGPTLPDGPSRLPLNSDLPLALGSHRLLFQMDPAAHYQVRLRPAPGEAALLSVAVCKLDWHWRVDDGDSHCLGQEVAVDADGSSSAEADAPLQKPAGATWGLAVRIFAEGLGPEPLTLRIVSQSLAPSAPL